MEEKINEELRQYKLFKIQETESKLRRYHVVYDEIKESFVVKFSKNASSNILRILLITFSILFLILGLTCSFPDQVIEFLRSEGEVFSTSEKEDLISKLDFFKYMFFGFGILFGFISYLLKLNNRKRNTIHSLSTLLEEVMNYMENSSNEEKRKYEYFVDSLAEKEKIKQ
ncbi:MAG: hypothetical protein WBL27_09010 [Salinimicrobium sp.]